MSEVNAPLFTMKVSGLNSGGTTTVETVRRAIVKHGDKGMRAFQGAMYLYATIVITSAMRLTPVLTGWLRRSRYVQEPQQISLTRFGFVAGFGAPYAAAVHDVWARHVTGQWKYLSTAIAENAPRMTRVLVSTMNRLIKANAGVEAIPVLHPTAPPYGPRPPVRRMTSRQRDRRTARAERNMAQRSRITLARQRARAARTRV